MNTLKAITFTLIGLTLPLAAHAKVETAGTGVDLEQHRTYSWTTDEADLAPAQQKIRDAVDAQLEAHGLEEVEANGDLNAELETAVWNEVRIDSRPPMTLRPRVDRFMYRRGLEVVDIRDVDQGRFEIRLTDGDDNLVWEGAATGTPRKKAEKNAAKIEKAAVKMFRDFPNTK